MTQHSVPGKYYKILSPQSLENQPILSKFTGLFASTMLGTATVLVSVIAFSSEAHAWLQVCNKTNESVWVAYGYESESIAGVTKNSKGWWNIQPAQCTIVDSDSAASEWNTFDGNYGPFYYAESDSGEITWPGEQPFCVQNDVFDYTSNGFTCPSGFYQLKFRRINSGGQINYTINLKGPTVINF